MSIDKIRILPIEIKKLISSFIDHRLPHIIEIQNISNIDTDVIDEENDLISYKTKLCNHQMQLTIECFSYDYYYINKDFVPIYKALLFHLNKKELLTKLHPNPVFKIVKKCIVRPQLYLVMN